MCVVGWFCLVLRTTHVPRRFYFIDKLLENSFAYFCFGIQSLEALSVLLPGQMFHFTYCVSDGLKSSGLKWATLICLLCCLILGLFSSLALP